MGYAKEPGGWGNQAKDQPDGTQDRTRKPEEAFPRDVDEGMGRHVTVAKGPGTKTEERRPAHR